MENQNNISIKDSNSSQKIGSMAVAIFPENPHFVFISKKTQRLVSALYLVTNLWDNSEPLKWKVRDVATRILPAVILLKDKNTYIYKNVIKDLKNNIFEAVSFLEVGFSSGLVSEMNLSIIKTEFTGLIQALDSRPIFNNENEIAKDFFVNTVNEISPRENKSYNSSPMSFKTSGSNQKDLSHVGLSQGQQFITQKNNAPENVPKDVSTKSERKAMILGLFNLKSDIDIKDVSNVLKNCGQKTIQRELLGLVASGVLKKVGEKRWSKYILA